MFEWYIRFSLILSNSHIITGLVLERRMKCSRAIPDEIFSEYEMMVLHRVSLEMDLADTLEEQSAKQARDDDDDMVDHHDITKSTCKDKTDNGRIIVLVTF